MNLSTRKKTDRVLERSMTTINQNGEVQRFDKTEVVLKNKEREDFFLLFTKHVAVLGNLGKRAHEVLSIILQSKVTWNNDVMLESVSKNEIAAELNTSVQVIKNAVTELVKHDIILTKKVDGGWKYMLNPLLFGRGKWNEIEAMKIQITKEFDFKNQHFLETVDTMTAYEGLPDKKNIKIIDSTEVETEKGVSRSALIEDMSKNTPKTLDDLFNFRSYHTDDQAILKVTQNKDLRDLAYQDLDMGN